MAIEAVMCAAAFCVALIPLLITAYRVKARGTLACLFTVSLWLVVPVGLVWATLNHREPVVPEALPKNRPIEVRAKGYVTSQACQRCHPQHYQTWHASYHRTMTQVASPETVIGDFQNQRLEFQGQTTIVHREGDQFSAEIDAPYWMTEDSSNGRIRVPIVMATGRHHYQVYWYPSGYGRGLAMLPFVYLTEEQRWTSRSAVFLWPGYVHRAEPDLWNHVCLRCHTTHPQTRPLGSDGLDTHVAELGISCEACHGPGETHVAVNGDIPRRYDLHLGGQPDPTIVHPGRLSSKRATELCGQCHGFTSITDREELRRRQWEGEPYRPGDDLSDSRLIVQPTKKLPSLSEVTRRDPHHLDTIFWSDGMVRVSGRELNGLIETPCYQRGELSCLSCHSMHKAADDPRSLKEWANDQLKPQMESNHACAQCHEKFNDETVLTAHTHHAVGSSGSLCYNCHMPHTAYGLLKAIRSHQIDVPSVAATLETGRPNACNQCHLDRSLGWSAENLEQWYGIPQPEMSDDQRQIAASVLWLLKGDAGQRALAAWTLDWEPAADVSGREWMAPYLAQLLADPYYAVRFIADRSLRRLPGFEDFQNDILASSEESARATTRAFQQWEKLDPPVNHPQAGQLLLGGDGTLRQDEFDRLLGERDNRPVKLNE